GEHQHAGGRAAARLHPPGSAGAATTVQSMTELVGRQLGPYRVIGQLGQGGMATAYLAEQPSLGRRVVLKVLLPHLVQDPDLRRRFLQEARTAARLEHPHVVPIYDVGSQGELHYIAMRWVDGPSLAQLVRQSGPL